MPFSSFKLSTLLPFLVAAAMFSTAAHGDELPKPDEPLVDLAAKNLPTLDQLIEATPNIDTSDPETKSFQFTVAVDTPVHCFEATVAWRRDELVGMRMLMGKNRMPGWMLSNQQTHIFDVCNGRILDLGPSCPEVKLRHADDGIHFYFGIKNRDKDVEPIVLDLRSMITENREQAQVTVAADGRFQITILPIEPDPNKKDPGGLFAVYESQAPHKLHSLRIMPGDNRPPFIDVSEVSFNEEADLSWPSVPADDLLPQGITIVNRSQNEVNMAVMRAFQIPFAMEDKDRRDQALFLGVDWDKAFKNAAEVGPVIERLWR